MQIEKISVEIYSYQRVNSRISKIASGAEYGMEKQFKNLLIFGILIVFQVVSCLRGEIRGISNRNPKKWGKED